MRNYSMKSQLLIKISKEWTFNKFFGRTTAESKFLSSIVKVQMPNNFMQQNPLRGVIKNHVNVVGEYPKHIGLTFIPITSQHDTVNYPYKNAMRVYTKEQKDGSNKTTTLPSFKFYSEQSAVLVKMENTIYVGTQENKKTSEFSHLIEDLSKNKIKSLEFKEKIKEDVVEEIKKNLRKNEKNIEKGFAEYSNCNIDIDRVAVLNQKNKEFSACFKSQNLSISPIWTHSKNIWLQQHGKNQ
jgi:hypothetical protein